MKPADIYIESSGGYPKMVAHGSGQGRSNVETGGVAALRRGFQQSENTGLGRKMPFMHGHELLAHQPLGPHKKHQQ